jgi:hypothetical protein
MNYRHEINPISEPMASKGSRIVNLKPVKIVA